MTYSEKLKDPRWQKKRLEIMERDKFACRHCGNAEETLNVHHRFYKRGAAPWDYEDWQLVTLCQKCHETLEDQIKLAASFMAEGGWNRTVVSQFIAALDAAGVATTPMDAAISAAVTEFSAFIYYVWFYRGEVESNGDRTPLQNVQSTFCSAIKECAKLLDRVEATHLEAVMRPRQ